MKKITQYIITKSCTMLVLPRCWMVFAWFLFCACLLFDRRVANPSAHIIQTSVCVLHAHHVRIFPNSRSPRTHQNLQPATRTQKRSFRHHSKDIGDALRSSNIKVDSFHNHPARPETGKNHTYKKEYQGDISK